MKYRVIQWKYNPYFKKSSRKSYFHCSENIIHIFTAVRKVGQNLLPPLETRLSPFEEIERTPASRSCLGLKKNDSLRCFRYVIVNILQWQCILRYRNTTRSSYPVVVVNNCSFYRQINYEARDLTHRHSASLTVSVRVKTDFPK